MLSVRTVLWPLCVVGSLLTAVEKAAAETYGYEIRLTQSIIGKRVFKGEIAPENGRFEEFATSGNTRVHFTGSVSGDKVSVYGELLITEKWRFSPFRVEGSLSDDAFTRSIVALSEMGPSARGSITITRRAPPVAAAPAIDLNAKSQLALAKDAVEPIAPSRRIEVRTAPLPPPEQPPLSRSQRREVQRQLSALGLYTAGIDGDFGPETRKAVRSFQRDNGLKPTGSLTDAEVALLAERAAERRALPQPSAPEPPAATQSSASIGRMTMSPAQTTAVPAPAASPQPRAASDAFDAVIATLEPIDETFVAVRPANVRAAPKVTADLVDMLMVGDRIDVLGRLPRKDWYVVARAGKPIGYVVVGQLMSETALA